jgi:hypothetical protein
MEFENMDNWTGGSRDHGLTFKQIIIQHINRVVLNGSVEWHGGYTKIISINPTVRNYIPNSRAVFINSIKMLRAILLGYFDKAMKEGDEKYKKEKKKLSELEDKAKEENEDKEEDYSMQKVENYTNLFEELIMLSKRLNFFEETHDEKEV